MQNKRGMHCFVSGKVQGVWFRAAAQEQAQALGLTGWARNLPDGRVEVLACGEPEKLVLFRAWLQKGPELARVDDLSSEEIPWQEHARFAVK
jgi:acylphosphatase